MRDQIGKAAVRTFVPLIVSGILTLTWFRGVNSAALTELVTLLVACGYYLGVYVLERYVHRNFGWLLGMPGIPKYDKG